MASWTKRAAIAAETIKIIESGTYNDSRGQIVDISSAISKMISGTVHYEPDSIDDLIAKRNEIVSTLEPASKIRYLVNNTTTLAAARVPA